MADQIHRGQDVCERLSKPKKAPRTPSQDHYDIVPNSFGDVHMFGSNGSREPVSIDTMP